MGDIILSGGSAASAPVGNPSNVIVRDAGGSGNGENVNPNGDALVTNILQYQIADEDSANLVKYFGFTTYWRGAGVWYIMKQDTTAQPYTYRYANQSNNATRTNYGAAGATGAWANRAALTYDYLYVLTGL